MPFSVSLPLVQWLRTTLMRVESFTTCPPFLFSMNILSLHSTHQVYCVAWLRKLLPSLAMLLPSGLERRANGKLQPLQLCIIWCKDVGLWPQRLQGCRCLVLVVRGWCFLVLRLYILEHNAHVVQRGLKRSQQRDPAAEGTKLGPICHLPN